MAIPPSVVLSIWRFPQPGGNATASESTVKKLPRGARIVGAKPVDPPLLEFRPTAEASVPLKAVDLRRDRVKQPPRAMNCVNNFRVLPENVEFIRPNNFRRDGKATFESLTAVA
jgi:hypothetical protein